MERESKTLGLLGFTLSLIGIILATFLRKSLSSLTLVLGTLIFGLILSIIQRKKYKTGLSLAGIIISIIGVILIFFFTFIAPIILNATMNSVKDRLENSNCFEELPQIISACSDGSNINIEMDMGTKDIKKGKFKAGNIDLGEQDLSASFSIPFSGEESRISFSPTTGPDISCGGMSTAPISSC